MEFVVIHMEGTQGTVLMNTVPRPAGAAFSPDDKDSTGVSDRLPSMYIAVALENSHMFILLKMHMVGMCYE